MENHKYHLSIYLPVAVTFENGPDGTRGGLRDVKNRALDEISLHRMVINQTMAYKDINQNKQTFVVSISAIREKPEILKDFNLSEQSDYLCFEAVLELSSQIQQLSRDDSYKNYSTERLAEFIYTYEFQELYKAIHQFVIAANIAKPGSILIDSRGYFFVNEKFYVYTSLIEHFFVYEPYGKWPILEEVEIQKIWNWVSNNQSSFKGISHTKVTRAYNAFSYLFTDKLNFALSEELFWSMVGLEAIYTNGRDGVMRQLLDKSRLVLGMPEEFEKKIKNMYNFRSRLLHGQKDIPNKFSLDKDDNIDSIAHENEFWESCLLARKMLLATLQKIIVGEIKDIEFSYVAKLIK